MILTKNQQEKSSMERDIFIIRVYELVAETMRIIQKSNPWRTRGCAPQLTDAEVITMEICGEFFKLHEDTEIYGYFKRHYHHYFPHLPSRTTFVRQAANLWQVKVICQSLLVKQAGQQLDPVQSIDTVPLPVCTYTRGGYRDQRFPTLADFGHCAAKKMNYYGFKLGLRIARSGMITHFPILSARAHEVNHLGSLIEGFQGLVPADKGFLDHYQQKLWLATQQTQVLTPVRQNMEPVAADKKLLRQAKYRRKLVETVGSQLTERFQIAKIRVKDFWHYQHRLYRKILSHTVAVFLNLQLGLPPLHFAFLASE
jgi:hypothetical protein